MILIFSRFIEVGKRRGEYVEMVGVSALLIDDEMDKSHSANVERREEIG